MTQPTIEHARKLRDLMREHGIVIGLGEPVPGKMCIEALVCHVLNLPHGDKPDCVGSEVNKFKIGLNDKPWSSPTARARGMERLGIAQLGSNTINQSEFKDTLWLAFGQTISPLIFRYIATKVGGNQGMLKHATEMENVITLTEARAKQREYAAISASAYAYDYGSASASASAYGYGYAHNYGYGSAYDYGYAYGYGYNYGYAYGYGYDVWFTKVADVAVQVLCKLKSPGCEWLYLCDE